ncbi:MAG: cbb3-type cytochrome oxidase assembly protein CcoS [Candidatus Sericytochromatia bacterium]
MSVLYFMLPIMAFVGIFLIISFFWAVRSGQFDDLESQKYRIFFDD